MPDKKSSGDNESKGSGGLVKIGALCAVLLGAGYFLGGMMGGGAAAEAVPATEAAAAAEAEAAAATDHEVGQIIDVEAVNINLAENHYLRVAISLGLTHEVHYEKPEKEFSTAPAGDVVLSVFSGMEMAELRTPEGRDHAKEMLMELIHEAYHGEVVDVFFTEFVMQ